MILKEIQHSVADAVNPLPAISNPCCRMMMRLNVAQCVIKIHLIIQIIEMTASEKIPIHVHIIYLGYKLYIGVALLYLRNGPLPEIQGNHESHITPEGINTFGGPKP